MNIQIFQYDNKLAYIAITDGAATKDDFLNKKGNFSVIGVVEKEKGAKKLTVCLFGKELCKVWNMAEAREFVQDKFSKSLTVYQHPLF